MTSDVNIYSEFFEAYFTFSNSNGKSSLVRTDLSEDENYFFAYFMCHPRKVDNGE